MILIEGYAVVSDDDCIANADGRMPEALKSEAEWAFFQAGLDAADVVVLGRLSHKVTPNPKKRLRLVTTSSVDEPQIDEEGTVFWNPAESGLDGALALFQTDVKRLAITGGQGVFDAFLSGEARYSAFFLSRMAGVRLVGGRKVFLQCQTEKMTAETVLERAGFCAKEHKVLDTYASVTAWRPTKR